MRVVRRRLIASALLVAALITGAAAAVASADPVAVLIQVNGAVRVQRSGQRAPVGATLGMSLMDGDRVIVAAGARAVLLYRTGRTQTATASLTVAAPAENRPGGLFNQTVRTLTQVATTDARTQPNRQGMIRPIAGAAVPVSPRNRINVLDVRPTFLWFRIPEAAGYTVQIRRAETKPPLTDDPADTAWKPVRYDVGADTTWTLPGSENPLVPGAFYEWTVAAADGGRVAEPQRFRIISAPEYTALARSLGGISAMGLDPAGDGLFMAALAYRDAGLFYEADRALNRLEAAGAGTGRAFHLLRGEVYDALGLLQAAAEAFRRAEAPETAT
ncbi:MAG: hypothetical protein HY703_08440 [Gemmatimonadetes bacterium]|nr:hypothetical protein [Gemmatimonadota bacterium]